MAFFRGDSGRASKFFAGSSSLFLNIRPRPQNFADLHNVLRALQQYGDVVMFKSLRFDFPVPASNKARITFRNPESADRLHADVPISFRVERIGRDPMETLFQRSGASRTAKEPTVMSVRSGRLVGAAAAKEDQGMNLDVADQLFDELADMAQVEAARDEQARKETREDEEITKGEQPTSEGEDDSAASEPPPASRGADRVFTISAFPVTTDSYDYVSRQAMHGPFDLRVSMAQVELAKSVPLLGLSDVDLRKPPSVFRFVEQRLDREAKKKTLMQVWREAVEERRGATGEEVVRGDVD